ncbi:hypothetical protein [Stenotrophomonas sp. UBA7606]|uniref:hypothetical protein n=1 Tax=Stenotrophomonas sp. UBA7606 TaxID=1947559 RepID=UPI0025D7A7A6|nr:hypothetical protein [Stenotrophomonas sp. UBA7606]
MKQQLTTSEEPRLEAPTRIWMEFPRILIRVRGRGFRKLREDDGPHRANGDGNSGGNGAAEPARIRAAEGRLRCVGGGLLAAHATKRHQPMQGCQVLRRKKVFEVNVGEAAAKSCKCHQATTSGI